MGRFFFGAASSDIWGKLTAGPERQTVPLATMGPVGATVPPLGSAVSASLAIDGAPAIVKVEPCGEPPRRPREIGVVPTIPQSWYVWPLLSAGRLDETR